jgi:uncharacterized protein
MPTRPPIDTPERWIHDWNAGEATSGELVKMLLRFAETFPLDRIFAGVSQEVLEQIQTEVECVIRTEHLPPRFFLPNQFWDPPTAHKILAYFAQRTDDHSHQWVRSVDEQMNRPGKAIIREISVAVRHGETAKAIRLLEESPELLTRADIPWESWLCFTADEGNAGFAEWLLEHGANLEKTSIVGETTPLALAASGGHLDMVKLLLSRGAKTDPIGEWQNPLMAAIWGQHLEVVKVLLEHGADPRSQHPCTHGTFDALGLAEFLCRDEIAKFLRGHLTR